MQENQISTRDNPLFPGVLAYLELIDNAWTAGMSEDEGALYIATLYYCGIVKNGHTSEVKDLLHRIRSIGEFCVPGRMISRERWIKFSEGIAQASADFDSIGQNSLSLAEKNLIEEFGIDLSKLPERQSVEDLFYSMGNGLSHEAQTALLYRLVAINFLGFAKIARDDGKHFGSEDLLWLTQLTDKSVDWSDRATDQVDLERLTSQLNMNIIRFFESFGIK